MGLQFQQSPTKDDARGRFDQEITKMFNKPTKKEACTQLSSVELETQTKRGVEK